MLAVYMALGEHVILFFESVRDHDEVSKYCNQRKDLDEPDLANSTLESIVFLAFVIQFPTVCLI